LPIIEHRSIGEYFRWFLHRPSCCTGAAEFVTVVEVALAVAIAFFAAVEGQVMFNVRVADTSTVATEKSIIANCTVAAIATKTEPIAILEYQMAETRLGFLH